METITDKTEKLWIEFKQLNATSKAQIFTLLLMLILFAVGVKFWYFLLPIFIVLILKSGNKNKLDYIGAKIAEPFLSAIDIILAETNESQEKSIQLGVIILGIVIVVVTIVFWPVLLPVWGILGSIPAFVLLPKRFKFNQLVTGVIILLLVVLPVLSKTLYAPARERISKAEELRGSKQYKKSMDALKEAQRTLAVSHFDKYTSQINTLIEENKNDIQGRQERNKKNYNKGLKAFNFENWEKAIKYFGQISKHFEKYDKAQDKKRQAKIAQDKQEYEEGLKAFNNKEWGKAIEYLRRVSSNCDKYKTAETKRKEAINHREKEEYYQGLGAFNAGEWEKSIEYFEKVIGEYSDEAESKIQQAEERIRQEKIDYSLTAKEIYNMFVQVSRDPAVWKKYDGKTVEATGVVLKARDNLSRENAEEAAKHLPKSADEILELRRKSIEKEKRCLIQLTCEGCVDVEGEQGNVLWVYSSSPKLVRGIQKGDRITVMGRWEWSESFSSELMNSQLVKE